MFTFIQVQGLLFLNWSGLYIIYLYWVELVFLSLYLGIKYWKVIKSEEWKNREVYECITNAPKEIAGEFASFVFSRVYLLALYFLIVGVTIVPTEFELNGINSIEQFLTNLVISDPVFIGAVFFIVFYYLKLIFSNVSYSKIALVQFSFDVALIDPKIFSPFFIAIGLPFMIIFRVLYGSSNDYSNTYLLAIMLLIVRFILDFYMAYIIRNELKKRKLI